MRLISARVSIGGTIALPPNYKYGERERERERGGGGERLTM